jgi:hypothetical protein
MTDLVSNDSINPLAGQKSSSRSSGACAAPLRNLPLETASQLRDLLNQAIAAAAEAPLYQPGLWSDATTADIARQLGRGR